jgi:hypothetical protein
MFDFNTFMAKVKQDNPSFKKWTKTSSLDPLMKTPAPGWLLRCALLTAFGFRETLHRVCCSK